MDEKIRNELALFRFSLIAPLVNGTANCLAKDYLEEVCSKPLQVPGTGMRELSPNTVRRWLSDYRRGVVGGQPVVDAGREEHYLIWLIISEFFHTGKIGQSGRKNLLRIRFFNSHRLLGQTFYRQI